MLTNTREMLMSFRPSSVNLIRDHVKSPVIKKRMSRICARNNRYETWSLFRPEVMEDKTMKTGKTSAATLGLVGGLVLGAWIGSELTMSRSDTPESATATVQAIEEPAAPAAPAKRKRVLSVTKAASVARVARAASGDAVVAPMPESTPKLVMTIPVSAPELHERIKPVLAKGTKVTLAAEGFTSAEQFATLAHAARNTQVPFILLKHRVLTEGQSLEDAIRASRPDVDARVEALRAKGEARADMLSLTVPAAVASSN
jgi:hypothetical protein